MALKYKFATKQEIPAEHQSLYVERDGAWLLDADGVVSQSKLDEFRQHNIALTNQLKRFEGMRAPAQNYSIDWSKIAGGGGTGTGGTHHQCRPSGHCVVVAAINHAGIEEGVWLSDLFVRPFHELERRRDFNHQPSPGYGAAGG